MVFLKKHWEWRYLAILLASLQAAVIISLESIIYNRVLIFLHTAYGSTENALQNPIVLVYFALFILAQIVNLILVIDAARMKNTLQVVAATLFNFSSLSYSIVQFYQLEKIGNCLQIPAFKDPEYCPYAFYQDNSPDTVAIITSTRPILIATIFFMFLFNLSSCFVSWKVYKEYGFSIFRSHGADLRKRRMLSRYHMFILLLKLNIYFTSGIVVQMIASDIFFSRVNKQAGNASPESSLITVTTIVGIVMAIVFIVYYYIGYQGVKRGSRRMMFVFLALLGGNIIFVCVGLWYIYSNNRNASKIWLTLFSIIDLGLNLGTVFYGVRCTLDFRHGSNLLFTVPAVDPELEVEERRRSMFLD